MEFCLLAEKWHVWKESEVAKQGRREVEVSTLFLGNDKNNAIAYKSIKLFLVFKLQV